MQFTLNLKLVLKLIGNVSLFARDHKILPSNFLKIPQTTRERILNFWSPNNTEGDSEFLTPKQHSGFRISDPPINTGEDSEFLIPQLTQERIRNFWSPKNKGEDSEFLTPKQHRRGFRISDPPNNTGADSEFLIPQTIQERIQNFWFPNNTGDLEFLNPQTTQERIQNFWFPKQQRRGYRIFNPLVNKNTIQEGFQYFRTPVFFSGLKAVKCLEF